jgi:hypothetical protein
MSTTLLITTIHWGVTAAALLAWAAVAYDVSVGWIKD